MSDTFNIKVTYDNECADMDTKGILTSALQKKYSGFRDQVFLCGKVFIDYKTRYEEPKNGFLKLKVISSKYNEEIYQVTYNEESDLPKDDENYIFEYIKECIKKIEYYKYRSIFEIDKLQTVKITVLTIEKVNEDE